MKLVENNKNIIGKVYTNPSDILDVITSLVSEVKIMDKDTVGIVLNKNIVTMNEGHTISINKGINVSVAHSIHSNPNIDIDKFLNKPAELTNMVEQANKLAEEKYLNLLRSQGVIINEDGSLDISNSAYATCH